MKYTFTLILLTGLFLSLNGRAQAPKITWFTPTQADSGAFVSIHGLHFTGATAVTFGGVASPYFKVEFDTLISAQLGNGASGKVSVTTPNGSDTLDGFTFVVPGPKPVVTAFTPTSAKTGDTIFVWGQHFIGASLVAFGGTYSPSFHVLSDTTLWAVVGAGTSGSVSVYNNEAWGSLSGFTYIAPPPGSIQILSFSPDSARTDDTVYIHGHGFNAVTGVTFGARAARNYTVFSDSLLMAIVGTGNTGYVATWTSTSADSLGGFVYIPNAIDTNPPPPPSNNFQLLSFSGVDSSGGILLNWVTQNDQSILYYFVTRTADSAGVFTPIGTVNSARVQHGDYPYQDNAHLTGTQYYQLKMEDTAGVYTYGPIIAVVPPITAGTVTSYPNPAVGAVTLTVPPTNTTSYFLLSDPSGRVVKYIAVPPNTQQIVIDVTGLTKGLYKIGWSDGSHKSGGSIFIAK